MHSFIILLTTPNQINVSIDLCRICMILPMHCILLIKWLYRRTENIRNELLRNLVAFRVGVVG
jgi:hypothetical protein